jgi:glycosyltransferase involved in cell wall biosynthesis
MHANKTIPRVSIVIACFNDLNIVKAVQSAHQQTYANKEIIVINDGSNQQTVKVIQSVQKFINILITQDNSGQSIARNKGIAKATGEYILNLDSDDYFEREFCEKAVAQFESNKAVKIVTCKARRFNSEGDIDVYTPRGGELENFLFSNSALGSSMFKKENWKACGGYEEKLPILGFEDWEFYLNMLKKGGFAYVIPEVLFNYQIRKNSTTSQIKPFKLDKFKYIILKHSELYKNNFEAMVLNLIERAKFEEMEKIKNTRRIDFKLGKAILKPLRFIKALLKY